MGRKKDSCLSSYFRRLWTPQCPCGKSFQPSSVGEQSAISRIGPTFGAAALFSCVNLSNPLKRIMDRRNGVLAATILGSSIVFIDSTVVNVILPRLQSEFQVTGVQIQ